VAPYFTLNPANASLVAGSSNTFTSLANGSQPISYQWQHSGTNLPGATGTALALTALTIADSGTYALRASNIGGASTSAVAQLTIYQNAVLLTGLSNKVVQVGDNVVLAVSATGSQPLGYTWRFNGIPYLNPPGPTLVINNVQAADSGFYVVTVTNQFGSVSSTSRVSVVNSPSAVVAWGDDSGGQTDVPPGLGDIVAVAGGDYHTIALRRNGTLLGWGYNGDGQATVPASALRFVAIAAGGSHNLAITEQGGVVGWGRNDFGQRNVPASASNNVVSIAAGDAHSLALLSGGTVVAWGDNTLGQSSVPQGLNGVRAIAAGDNHSLALRSNTVIGWGFNLYGQASPPASLTNASAIAAGYLHSAALRFDGTVVCWGDNTYGQTNVPPGLNNVVAIAAGDFHTYALRSDGTIVAWGSGQYGQLTVPASATNCLAINSGYFHGLALVPPFRLNVRMSAAGLIVEWTGDGTLQSAPTPSGPFTDMPGYSRAYTNVNMTVPARFFRLRR
jgi:alpha-tubulin suppressor-like RCC1 family protein